MALDAAAFKKMFLECAGKLEGDSTVENKTPESEKLLKSSEKTIQQIDQFKNKLELASQPVVKDPIRLTPLAAKPESNKNIFSFGKSETKDVEFVKEITGTDSEKEKADKYGLPDTFYRQK